MTTPAGNPPWARSTGYADYGGHASKRNYQGQPCINSRTDIGAEHLMRLASDLAAVTRMSNFCEITFTMASGTTAPIVTACRLMTAVYTGSGYTGDSPPTGFPTVTGIANGQARIAFSSSYTDDYGESADYTPEFPRASSHEDGVGAAAKVDSGNVEVYAFDTSTKVAVTGKTVTVAIA